MTEKSERAEYLYLKGESFFSTLCIDSRLTATKPQQDKNGWDFFVEFPQNRIAGVDMDAQPAPIKFLCQVKATDKFVDRKLSMTVSNFEHLARAPIPSFVFVVDYKDQKDPQDCFLCPFNSQRISQTLKRVRELESDGLRDLHRHTMTLVADLDERISLSDPRALENGVLAHTGIDLAKYQEQKSFILETVGHENGRYTVGFTAKGDVTDVIDAMLGIGEIQIENARVSSQRFGVEIFQHELTAGSIQIQPTSVGKCSIVAKSISLGTRAEVLGDIYAAAIPGTENKHVRLRVRSTALDVRIEPAADEGKLEFWVDPDTEYLLDELIKGLEFVTLCTHEGTEIEFLKDGIKFASTPIRFDGIDGTYTLLLQDLKGIRGFLDYLNIREPLKVKPRDLFGQSNDLLWTRFVTSRERRSIEAPIDALPALPKRCNGTFGTCVAVQLGNKYVIAYCWWDADFRISKSMLRAHMKYSKIFDAKVVTAEEVGTMLASFKDFQLFCSKRAPGFSLVQQMDAFAKCREQLALTPNVQSDKS